MKRIQELVALCKGSVSVTVNEGRSFYKSVEAFLDSREVGESEVSRDVRQQMIERDTVVEVQFYPHTPIGFYRIFDADIERAVDRALEVARREAGRRA